MNLKINEKQRVIIQFCESNGHTTLETKTLLEKSFGKDVMKPTAIYSWYKRFHGGREAVRDDPSYLVENQLFDGRGSDHEFIPV